MVAITRPRITKRVSPQGVADVFSQWLTLPDDNRIIEIIDGVIVMSPGSEPHSSAMGFLYIEIGLHVRQNDLGKVYPPAFGVMIREDFLPEPDISFVAKGRLGIVKHRWIEGPPDLVVEVLSPSTESRDRYIKLPEYIKFGVPEVWLVDTEKQSVEVYAGVKGKVKLSGKFMGEEVIVSKVLPGLKVKVEGIFEG